MMYEVRESEDKKGEFLAFAIDNESRGEEYIALFSGQRRGNEPKSMSLGKTVRWTDRQSHLRVDKSGATLIIFNFVRCLARC
jgi:hypothetical protein